MTDVKKEGAILVNVSDGGDPEKALGELEALTCTLGYEVRAYMKQRRAHPDKSYYIGRGKLDELKSVVEATDSCVVIFENEVSGTQLNNLEKYLGVTVMDRSTLIIEIFARHATTNEGKLQVELMRKKKLLPRVLGQGTVLSRQGGGGAGGGGARRGGGEQQQEIDKRAIRQEIRSLERRLKKLSSERAVRRERRIKNAVKVVSLVGYTNAGKSTILNALTGSDALVEDKLFATLDTTTRSMKLPSGQKVLLSDTVGFISELPAGLVKAFSSTLEEALSAEALIIVADASHPDALGCLRETERTLEELGAREKAKILVINKTDSIYDDISYAALRSSPYMIVETSMKEGKGIQELRKAMEKATDEAFQDIVISSPCSTSLISGLYRDGTVKEIEYGDGEVTIKARLRNELIAKYMGSGITELE